MEKQFGGSISEDEMTHETLAKMLRMVAGIDRMVIPGDFKSGVDERAQAISCSVKVSQGFLYPLKTSMIFIQKPIMYIKHKEIKYVEFSRIGHSTGGTGRSFDFSLVLIETDSNLDTNFKNVDKQELKVLMNYFKVAGIKMRQIDSDTNKAVDMDDVNSEELNEEIRQSQVEEVKIDAKLDDEGVTIGRSGRRRVPVQTPVRMEMEDDYDEEDEDDESFGEKGPEGSSDGGEEGEEEMEDDIDEEIDKDELKVLKGNKLHDKKQRRKK